jgi:hypothetical protein
VPPENTEHADGGRIFRDENEALETLRSRLGAEQFQRWLRSSELERHPRPLTDDERRILREAAVR